MYHFLYISDTTASWSLLISVIGRIWWWIQSTGCQKQTALGVSQFLPIYFECFSLRLLGVLLFSAREETLFSLTPKSKITEDERAHQSLEMLQSNYLCVACGVADQWMELLKNLLRITLHWYSVKHCASVQLLNMRRRNRTGLMADFASG